MAYSGHLLLAQSDARGGSRVIREIYCPEAGHCRLVCFSWPGVPSEEGCRQSPRARDEGAVSRRKLHGGVRRSCTGARIERSEEGSTTSLRDAARSRSLGEPEKEHRKENQRARIISSLSRKAGMSTVIRLNNITKKIGR